MRVRGGIACLMFVLLIITLALGFADKTRADDEFSLRLTMNGVDALEAQTIVIDPEKKLEINLRIFDVTEELTLKKLTMIVTFAGIDVLTRSESLGDFHMLAGDIYRQALILDISDELKAGDRPLVTGIYRSQFRLEYTVGDQARTWSQWKNLKLPGNPVNTPMGLGGIAVGLGTLTAFLFLFRSAAVPSLPSGAALPMSAPVKALPRLYEFASERLESTTRGRVTGSIVNAAKRRIIKDKCPICETRLRHGYCFTCKKSAKEVRDEYTNKLKALCLQGGQLLADAQVTTMENLCSKLNISGKLGADVIETLRHARLVKVKGIAHKLAGKAITAGIGTGLSTIIWITIGGFAVLSAPALIGILAASIVIPLAVTRGLQIRAKRAIRKSKE